MRYWPDSLPTPIGPGYGLTAVDQFLRSDMEVGPARARRITRARRDQIKAVWVFSPPEFEAFRAWFEDRPWSLGGDSDDLSHWSVLRAEWSAGAGTGPSGQAVGRLLETSANGTHRLILTLPALSDGQIVVFTASVRPAGRSRVRLALAGRDGTDRRLDVDLASGTGYNATGLAWWAVQPQSGGWHRIIMGASVGTGANTVIARLSPLLTASTESYTGTGVDGLDLAQINIRVSTGADLFLPTDAAGHAKGAAGGPAWALIPVFTGGAQSPRECRFEKTFSVEVRQGLHTHVSADLEVRHA